MISAPPRNLTSETFVEEVLQTNQPVLVRFYKSGDDKQSSAFHRVAEENQGGVKFCQLDVARAGETASEYNVRVTPSFLLFKGGEVNERIQGAVPAQVLQQMVSKHL